VTSDQEAQTRPVRPSYIDALAIPDVDHPHPATVDEHPRRRPVVDRHPFALIETQQQVRAGDQRIGNAHVGTKVTSNDDIMACGETAL
jgi:hypothetical protein